MPDPLPQATANPDDLFDKYLLPKVALTVILAASLVGTVVTDQLAGQLTVVTAAKWVFLVTVGVVTGGLVWKHLFVRPQDVGADASKYCAAMYARFDRITLGAAVILAVSGFVVLDSYRATLAGGVPLAGFTSVVVLWIVVLVVSARRSVSIESAFRSPLGLLALALAVLVVVAMAFAEVAMRGGRLPAAVVRSIHLLAFASWIGGAVWNIFVAVPTGQERPTLAVVRAAGDQLERFRWAVRFIIPTLIVTGLYQAVDALGVEVGAYLSSYVGWLVLAKVGSIGLLFVIFKLCPMWRACSPIDGVCDLEDGGGEPTVPTTVEGSTDD